MVSQADDHHILQASKTTLGEAFSLRALGSPRSLWNLRVREFFIFKVHHVRGLERRLGKARSVAGKLTRRRTFSPLKKTQRRGQPPPSSRAFVRQLPPWRSGRPAPRAGCGAPARAPRPCSSGRVKSRLTQGQGSPHGPQCVESNKQASFYPVQCILGCFSHLTNFRTVFTDSACLITLYLKFQKQTCNILYFNINIHSWSLYTS